MGKIAVSVLFLVLLIGACGVKTPPLPPLPPEKEAAQKKIDDAKAAKKAAIDKAIADQEKAEEKAGEKTEEQDTPPANKDQ